MRDKEERTKGRRERERGWAEGGKGIMPIERKF